MWERRSRVRYRRLHCILLFAVLACAPGLAAQEPDTTRIPTGVRLGLIYQTSYRPEVAVRPFDATPETAGVAERVSRIIDRDLDYSDRFEMAEVPPSLSEGAVDYGVWNGLGVVYLVTGAIEPTAGGYRVRVLLHDVVYGRVDQLRAFEVPSPESPDFRMAVHAISDEVVQWIAGEPGAAATRILFVRRRSDGGRDLMIVDSDGENLRRVASTDELMHSPVWSPDGRRVAYAAGPVPHWRIIERDLATGEQREVVGRAGEENLTPAWAPDAERLAFASSTGAGQRLYRVNASQACCLERLSSGPRDDLSPSYSPDGRRLAFNSNRLGQPHIYVMPADGGDAELLSPFVYGEPGFYTSPDWAPSGSLVAFHGRSRGGFQIMVADADGSDATVRQLTEDGGEDPSWAPDARHIVFSGRRSGGLGLYVLDSVTGRIRPLVLGGRYLVPDWSPTLAQASARIVGGR